ncbi:GNAT family N-acetyltransferase [Bordetella muralis]|uniref:GNAT family N-acetyltransferase n=1 Tax=Bordetella muralis TaxID=1649130 RepID=UPI0039F05FD3
MSLEQEPVANGVEYRLLNHADVAAFRVLRAQMLADSPESFMSSLEDEAVLSEADWSARVGPNDGALIIGAFVAGELKGSAGVFRHRGKKAMHKATIWGVYVHPDLRGKGAARALMTAAIAHTRKLPGIRQITLNVTASNAAAFQLYSSLGFQLCGEEPDSLCIDGKLYADKHMFLRLVDTATAPAPFQRQA